SSDEATLNTAAENLLGKTEQQVDEIALKTLEGHVRGVCATLTVEEVNSDRDAIASKILGMAGNDLRNMGIEIRSFVIKEIEDAQGYLDALGVKRTEEVKRDARMGKAGANREATIAEAQAAQEAATADGEKRKLIITAEGEKERAILVAEGERERLSRTAAGEAERIRQEGTAEADIIRLKGEAQAYAIKATGLAEAEAMRAKAEAWGQYGRAAVTQLIVEK